MYKRIVIGIDQSYQNTGVSVVCDGKIEKISSIDLSRLKTNSDKRKCLYKKLSTIFDQAISRSDIVVCIVERARLHGGSTNFINIDAIKAIGALTATIVDAASERSINVYSVDTRCWKSQVVGTSKGKQNKYNVPKEKWPTIQWVIEQGFEESILVDVTETRKTKYTFKKGNRKYMYDNDAADSAAIAMFWYKGDHTKLQQER